MSKTHDTNEIYIPSYAGTKPVYKPVGRPSISKGSTLIYENILQEYSTLAFLMGGKSVPDPELVFEDKKLFTFKGML